MAQGNFNQSRVLQVNRLLVCRVLLYNMKRSQPVLETITQFFFFWGGGAVVYCTIWPSIYVFLLKATE
jgi:hypothetical protein